MKAEVEVGGDPKRRGFSVQAPGTRVEVKMGRDPQDFCPLGIRGFWFKIEGLGFPNSNYVLFFVFFVWAVGFGLNIHQEEKGNRSRFLWLLES